MFDLLDNLIWCIGCIILIIVGIKLIAGLYNIFGYFIDGSIDFKSYGKYACVTGCTDGIGLEYAAQLARKGLDLILISRSKEKLEKLSISLQTQFKVKTEIIVADFTDPTIYSFLRKSLRNYDIGVLVNNVGMASSFPYYYYEYDHKYLIEIVNCNLLSAAMMSSIVYPQFIEKKKGILINITSASGFSPGIMGLPYAATKAAEQKFTEGLLLESALFSRDIIVQDVAPCYVASKLSQRTTVAYHIPTPEQFVQSALKTVGRMPFTAGYFFHQIEHYLLRAFPNFIFNQFVLKNKLAKRAATT